MSTKNTRSIEIEDHVGLVRSLAFDVYERSGRRVPLEDLAAYGFVGLLEAAERFDFERGVRFATFAWPRVRGAILNGLTEMMGRRGPAASEEPALAPADETPATAPKPTIAPRPTTTAAAFLDRERTLDRGQPDAPDARLAAAEARAQMALLVGSLPDQMRELLHLVYVSGLNLTAAGQQMSLSRSRASRVHTEALDRLAVIVKGRDDRA